MKIFMKKKYVKNQGKEYGKMHTGQLNLICKLEFR